MSPQKQQKPTTKKPMENNIIINTSTDLSGVPITHFINQATAELIGYQAYYKDGSNKFYSLEDLESILNGAVSNPLIELRQVGKKLKK